MTDDIPERPTSPNSRTAKAQATFTSVRSKLADIDGRINTALGEIEYAFSKLREARDDADLKDMGTLANVITRNIGVLQKEEQTLNALDTQRGDAAGQIALDLNAAQLEVGRRLACLRGARDDGRVSDGAVD